MERLEGCIRKTSNIDKRKWDGRRKETGELGCEGEVGQWVETWQAETKMKPRAVGNRWDYLIQEALLVHELLRYSTQNHRDLDDWQPSSACFSTTTGPQCSHFFRLREWSIHPQHSTLKKKMVSTFKPVQPGWVGIRPGDKHEEKLHRNGQSSHCLTRLLM